MIGRLVLKRKEDHDYWTYNFHLESGVFDYGLSIITDLTEDFESLISNTKDLNQSIEDSLEINDDQIIEYSEILNQCKRNKSEFLSNIEYVSFEFDIEEVFRYIEKNPILKTKKIVIDDIDFDYKKMQEIKKLFGKDRFNLYFNLINDDYNKRLVSWEEYSDVTKTIYKIEKEVNKFNFSQIEKIMYVYDWVRNRVYTVSADTKDSSRSRSLTSVLRTNEIVCAGYAALFKTILSKLGIDCREIILISPDRKTSHARNLIYVKDDKHSIDGVYYFDPTFDSKKSENDNSYLLSYMHFAKTKRQIEALDNGRYIELTIPYYSNNMALELIKILEENGFENIPKNLRISINKMSDIIYDEYLLDAPILWNMLSNEEKELRKEEIFIKSQELAKKFDSSLSAEVLLKVLYTVRKKQYQTNPQKYQFAAIDFYKIFLNSDWKFDGLSDVKTTDSKEFSRLVMKHYIDYLDETNLDKKIEQAKSVLTLKKRK